jgi:hypothetical protein|tara:strand:- start:12 stop:131 length:120 start_codon:yes stop_codon:yes gene_type:complete
MLMRSLAPAAAAFKTTRPHYRAMALKSGQWVDRELGFDT